MEKKTMLETGLKYLGVATLLWGLLTPWAVAGPEQDTELAEKEFARGDLVAALGLWTKAAEQGYANATELADYLVAKGIPFREAHHIVGEAVVEAIRLGKALEALSLADLQKFSPVIGDDVYPILALQSCLDKRAAKGGVSPQQVALAITEAKIRLS